MSWRGRCILLLVGCPALWGCSNEKSVSTASSGGGSAPTAGAANGNALVVQGTLDIGGIPQDVVKNDAGETVLSATAQPVEIKDARNTLIAESLSAENGAFSVIVPAGALAIGSPTGLAALWQPLRLWLQGGESSSGQLSLSSVITRTANRAVVGFRNPLILADAKAAVLQVGNVAVHKITAIRGQFRLDGARDHTGISVYIPGTSFSARTDASGQFLMTFLQAGSYTLRAERDGYLPSEIASVSVTDNETTLIEDAQLKLSGGVGLFRVRQLGNEGKTKSRSVSYEIEAGSADRFKGGLASQFENLTYGPVPSTFEVTFPSDGIFEVKMSFADADGYETVLTRTILVDTVPPVASAVRLTDRTTGNPNFTNETSVLALHPSCEDIDKLAILPASVDEPRETDFVWDCRKAVAQSDFLFAIPAREESYSYNIWARDVAGNVSTDYAAGSIELDVTAPANPVLLLSDVSSGSLRGTDTATVSARAASCTDIALIAFSEEMLVRPPLSAFQQPCSTAANAYTYVFQNGEVGIKRLYAWAVDRAGNPSPTVSTATILLDATPPAAPSFAYLRDSAEVTVGYINDRNPIWAPSSCVDVDALFVSTSPVPPAFNATGWIPCDTAVSASVLLPAGDGSKTVYLWARDGADNVSATAGQASIVLDTTPPDASGLVFTLRDSSSFSSVRTNSLNVSYSVPSCDGELDRIFFSESPSANPSFGDFATVCSNMGNYTLSFAGAGNPPRPFATKTAYFWVRDRAGNVSTNSASDSISYNETPFTYQTTNSHDTITFTVNAEDAIDVTVRYGLSAGDLSSSASSSFSSLSQTITLSGLTPGTLYYFRVESTDPISGSLTTQSGSVKTYYSKSGTISSDESWNATDVPYYVPSNLTVNSGVTVTVGPGVTVRMGANRTLVVQGKLKVLGAAGNIVRFIPHASSETQPFWSGISLAASATNVTVDGSDQYVDGSIIRYAEIFGAGSTGDVLSLGGATGIYLDHVTFNGIGGQSGMPRAFVKGTFESRVYLRNSTLTGFPSYATYGVSLSGGASGSGILVIEDNRFLGLSGERQYMISANSSAPSGGLTGKVSLARNEFSIGGVNSSNPGSGIALYTTNTSATVSENILDAFSLGQSYSAMNLKSSSILVEKNVIRNADSGIYFDFQGTSSTFTIRKNIFWRGSYALCADRASADGHTLNFSQNSVIETGMGSFGSADYPYCGSPSAFGLSRYFGAGATISISNNLFQKIAGGGSQGSVVNMYQPSGKTVTYSVTGNTFSENTTPYMLYAPLAATTLDATGNDWDGVTNATTIGGWVFDYEDNASRAQLNLASPLAVPSSSAPLKPPANVQVVRNGTSATVSWNANNEADLAGYKVYWDDDDGEYPFDGLADCVGSGTLTCTLSGLPASGAVKVRVTAYDAGATHTSQMTLVDILSAFESWFSTPITSY